MEWMNNKFKLFYFLFSFRSCACERQMQMHNIGCINLLLFSGRNSWLLSIENNFQGQ